MKDSRKASDSGEVIHAEDIRLCDELLMGDDLRLSSTLIRVPVYVGGYFVGGKHGFGFMLEKKPNTVHRFFMKLCLGIEWINNK